MTAQPEPCTNSYCTRRHLSVDLTEDPHYLPGRSGKSLCCPGGFPVEVYDEVGINTYKQRWAYGKPVDLAALPACRNCERVAAKLGSA